MVQNQGAQAESCRVRWQILDAAGKVVGTRGLSGAVGCGRRVGQFHGQRIDCESSTVVARDAELYSAVVTVESGGKVRDAERISFGVRDLKWDADKGFFLNGKRVEIKGTCNHHDHAGVGAALPDRLQWYRVGVLKDMGGNAVRTSHNMPTPEWVEACDRLGMMMMCETRLMSANPEGMAQLEAMVKRYRNSPSIILWSMGNEEWTMMFQPQGPRVVDDMIARTHELDPTRLCTAAVNTAFQTHFPEHLDVMGFNYNLKEHDPYHKLHPKQPSVGSETASTVSTRGIYSTDKLRNWVSAYDLNHTEWSQLAEEWWKFYAAREWLVGRICVDRLRLSRRADAVWLAVGQFAVRHCRHVRLSQGQFLLLQGVVGSGAGAASVSALELGADARASRFRCGCIRIWIRSSFS